MGIEGGQAEAPGAVARELSLIYLLAGAVTLVVSHTPGVLIARYGHLMLAAAFLGLALHMARRPGRSARAYGIDLAGVLEASPDEPEQGLFAALRGGLPVALRELGFALKVALVVFPPFVLAFALWHGPRPFTWHAPPAPLDLLLTHLVAIALPEEALFRGYFQTRLSELFTRRVTLLGVSLSPAALTCQAAMFALLHFLVAFVPTRFAVFFPGLLFGWMRARRGGIGAAMWFHAMCNLLAEVLTRGYL